MDSVAAFLQTIKDIRNYLFVIRPDFFSYIQSNDENKFIPVLSLFDDNYDKELKKEIEDTYNISIVQKHGGYEDAGHEMWYVFKLNDKYFKLPACYNSYDDSEYYWDSVHEVVPKDVMVTVYGRVDSNEEDSW